MPPMYKEKILAAQLRQIFSDNVGGEFNNISNIREGIAYLKKCFESVRPGVNITANIKKPASLYEELEQQASMISVDAKIQSPYELYLTCLEKIVVCSRETNAMKMNPTLLLAFNFAKIIYPRLELPGNIPRAHQLIQEKLIEAKGPEGELINFINKKLINNEDDQQIILFNNLNMDLKQIRNLRVLDLPGYLKELVNSEANDSLIARLAMNLNQLKELLTRENYDSKVINRVDELRINIVRNRCDVEIKEPSSYIVDSYGIN